MSGTQLREKPHGISQAEVVTGEVSVIDQVVSSPQVPPPPVSESGNQELEATLRKALDAGDLGKLCRTLGEAFCLPSRTPHEEGYDSGSDTTAPADHDQSSSELGTGSEIGGEGNTVVTERARCSSSRDDRKPVGGGVNSNVSAVATAAEIPGDLLARAWGALLGWREALAEGDLLDVFNSTEGAWYLGKVVPLEEEESDDEEEDRKRPGAGRDARVARTDGASRGGAARPANGVIFGAAGNVRIHYQGWPSKYDETFERESPSLQPVHTHTKRAKKPDRRKKRPREVTEWVREDEFGNIVARGIVGQDEPLDDDPEDEADEPVAEEPLPDGVATNRFGRKLVPRVSLPAPKDRRKASSDVAAAGNDDREDVAPAADGEEQKDPEVAAGEQSTGLTGATGKKRTSRAAFDKENGGSGSANCPEDWVCSTCFKLDTPCMSDMVVCDGPCLRSFHVVCLDLDEADLREEKWYCEDCQRGEHACWQCGDVGQVNVMGGVFKCMVNNCGRFYHRHCVEMNKNSAIKQDLDEGEDGHPLFKFRCGYHICDTCSAKSGSGTKNHLYQCMKCPVSYHLNCIPPDARYHELALLCGDHPEDELPPLKQEDSVLQVVDATSNDDTESTTMTTLALPNLKLPKNPPKVDAPGDFRHFRLPMSILTSYNSKPPPFQHICAMHCVVPRPPRVEPNGSCLCNSACGENCLNYMLRTECVCGTGIRGRYQNCKQGPNCGNRRLQDRVSCKVVPFREPGMGWGLKVAEDVPKNTLVGEYVGEVIDEAMMEHRMSEQRRLRPNDGEFYIMELGHSLFVDAKEKGNLMRLINHSCNPNCDVQAWNVAGQTRLAIYAMKDIPKDSSLSYDYKFSTNETAKFKCMCGAANCRGTLAPKSREEEPTEDGSKLKGKARKEMLQKRERLARNRQARNELGQRVTSRRLSLTGRVLPGDKTAEVKAGPPVKYFGFARDQRLFLVRNARAGADLLTRKHMLMCRVVRPTSTAIESTPKSRSEASGPNSGATGTPDSSRPKTDGSARKVSHGATGHRGTVGSGATGKAPGEAPRGASGGDNGGDVFGARDRALGGDTDEDTARTLRGDTDGYPARALGGDIGGDSARALVGDTDGDSARTLGGDTDGDSARTLGGDPDGDSARTLGGDIDGDSARTLGGNAGGDSASAQRKPTGASARSAEASTGNGSVGRKRTFAYPESSDGESSNASDAIAGRPPVVARSTENGVQSTKRRARPRASECESRSTERSSRRAVRGKEHPSNGGGTAKSSAVFEGQEIEQQTDEQGGRGNKRAREGTEEEVDQNSRRSSATRRRSGLQLKR